jgi:hypothetical protein
MDEVREESGVSFTDIDTQARKCAMVADGEVTRKELDSIFGNHSPDYNQLRPLLPAKAKIPFMGESFKGWGRISESLTQTLGGVPDSVAETTQIFRIKVGAVWHELRRDLISVTAVGGNDLVDSLKKQIDEGAKAVNIQLPDDDIKPRRKR